jgi:hypothetical protein
MDWMAFWSLEILREQIERTELAGDFDWDGFED